LTGGRSLCYGRRDMRSGVETGREAQVCESTLVPAMESVFRAPTNHFEGLTLTDNLFSAKVDSSTV